MWGWRGEGAAPAQDAEHAGGGDAVEVLELPELGAHRCLVAAVRLVPAAQPTRKPGQTFVNTPKQFGNTVQ